MSKVAAAFHIPCTSLWDRVNSDSPFGPHKVGKRAQLSPEQMADFTEEREHEDYGQRSLTPAQFGVAYDAKRNGDFFNYISCIFISKMIYIQRFLCYILLF